jgi:hypothetical protein
MPWLPEQFWHPHSPPRRSRRAFEADGRAREPYGADLVHVGAADLRAF